MGRVWLLWGCLMGFVSVALGAFAAHGLKPMLNQEEIAILATANQYITYHAFALLVLGLWNHWEKWSRTLWSGLCFLFGILFFSGSLYLYVLFGVQWAVLVTPVGGSLFLFGWFLFAISVIRTRNSII